MDFIYDDTKLLMYIGGAVFAWGLFTAPSLCIRDLRKPYFGILCYN